MADEFFGNKDDVKIPSKIINHLEIYYPDEKTTFPSNNLLIERALKGESTNEIDVVFLDPFIKEKKQVLISGRPLIDQNDKVVAFVRTIKDIRKDKQ